MLGLSLDWSKEYFTMDEVILTYELFTDITARNYSFFTHKLLVHVWIIEKWSEIGE